MENIDRYGKCIECGREELYVDKSSGMCTICSKLGKILNTVDYLVRLHYREGDNK